MYISKKIFFAFLVIPFFSCQPHQNIDYEHEINVLNDKLFDCNSQNCTQMFDSVFYLLSKTNYPKGLSDAYARKGLFFENTGQFDSAYHYYLLSTTIRKKMGDKKLIAFGFTNLAETLQSLKNWDLCRNYLDSAWTFFHEVNDTIYLMKINQQYGKYYAEQGVYNKALPFFLNGMNYALATSDQPSLRMFAQSLGNLYGSLQNYDSSNYYYMQWHNLIASDDYYDLFEYNCCISSNYIENGEFAKAENEILEARENFVKGNIDSIELQYLIAREHELAIAMDDFKLAYIKLKELNDINDFYYNLSTSKAIAEMEVRYQTAEKNTLNQTLLAQNSNKNWMLFLLLTVVILLIIIGYILYKNFLYRHRTVKNEIQSKTTEIEELIKNQELNNLNSMLRGQLEERQRIAKDLHDSLGSTLSTIKLIIGNLISNNVLESKNLQNANELIDNACKDVRKIAHDLFQVSNAKSDFIDEIKKVLKSVELNNNIKTNLIINKVNLMQYPDIQKELYFISQELINNTLKYAKANEINIQLNIINDELNYTFDDNGIGFKSDILIKSNGIGYKSLDQRVKKLNGKWILDSTPNYGMTLFIEIPLS